MVSLQSRERLWGLNRATPANSGSSGSLHEYRSGEHRTRTGKTVDRVNWRNIAIALIDLLRGVLSAMACLRQLSLRIQL
jgi:hypothetical protein